MQKCKRDELRIPHSVSTYQGRLFFNSAKDNKGDFEQSNAQHQGDFEE
jgi:hypothetical protein